MSNKGVSFIFPVLNERKEIIINTISIANAVCKKMNLETEIFLCDGGSDYRYLSELRKELKRFANIKLILDFPLIRPNKDVAIMNSAKLCNYENIIISDVDITNIENSHFKTIIGELILGMDMVMPNLNRTGGRWNRLLGNPIMRLCFKDEYNKIPYPAPGILGIKKTILQKIIQKDFFYDWGGEIQIPIVAAQYTDKISSPIMYKVDSKKRPINNMIKDAFQVWRTNIYLFKKYACDPDITDYKDLYLQEHEEFRLFLESHSEIKEFFDYDNFVEILTLHSKDPRLLFEFIRKVYTKTQVYEFAILNYMVVLPLSKILFNIDIKEHLIDKKEKEIPTLSVRAVSIFADYLAYLLITASNSKNSYSFEDCLLSIDKTKTEFRDVKILDLADLNNNQGFDLSHISETMLCKAYSIIKMKDPILRNMEIYSLFKSDEVGFVDKSLINYSALDYSAENINLDISDVFVKTSILTTIAGYLKTNKITVNQNYPKAKQLSIFLSYVLNNRKYAPMRYTLDLRFNSHGINQGFIGANKYDCVILFSGGIDSTATLLLALEKGLNPLLLWIGFGQKNETQEYATIKSVSHKIHKKVSIVRIDLGNYINTGWKDWDYIIPARNFIFVSIAAAILKYSTAKKTYIFMSAHKEEIKNSNTDKSMRFFKTCSKIFSEHAGKKIIVTTPFIDVTKAEILSYWRRNWLHKFKITPYHTVTCYYGKGCGKCKACYKRNLALVAGGLKPDAGFSRIIFSDPDRILVDDFIKRIDTFPSSRKYEYLLALYTMKKYISRDISDYLSKISKKEFNHMLARKREIESVDLKICPI